MSRATVLVNDDAALNWRASKGNAHPPRRTLVGEIVKRNKRSLVVRLPGGAIVDRKLSRDVVLAGGAT